MKDILILFNQYFNVTFFGEWNQEEKFIKTCCVPLTFKHLERDLYAETEENIDFRLYEFNVPYHGGSDASGRDVVIYSPEIEDGKLTCQKEVTSFTFEDDETFARFQLVMAQVLKQIENFGGVVYALIARY